MKDHNSPKSPTVERGKVTWLRSNEQSRAEFGISGMGGLFKKLERLTQSYVRKVEALHKEVTSGGFYK